MDLTTDIADGSITVKLSGGVAVRIPKLSGTSKIDIQDVQNVTTALLSLISDLDDRIAVLERGRAAAAGRS